MSEYDGLRCPHCCGKLPGYVRRDAELTRIREETIHDVRVLSLENQKLALENAAMETAAQLGDAENRIAVAMNYLTDETRDRITRIRLAQLALEHKYEPCGRLLVGLGSDVADPICWREPGHEGICVPACDYCDGSGATAEGDEGRFTHWATCIRCNGTGLRP